MKIAINLALVALAAFLSYMVYESVRVPIEFKNTWDSREITVRARLVEIAELQKMYKSLKEDYAPSFDSLQYVLTNDTFLVEVAYGDKYDTSIVQRIEIVKIPAVDSLQKFISKSPVGKTNPQEYFAEIATVPYSKGEKFQVAKDSAIVSGGVGGEAIKIPTFEVKTLYKTYLPEYDSSYMMYNSMYNPTNVRKVGDLSKPSTSGNW